MAITKIQPNAFPASMDLADVDLTMRSGAVTNQLTVNNNAVATEAYVDNELTYKVSYFESANAPTVANDSVRAGDLWKDTDTNVVYMATVENNIATWFEV